MSPAGEQERSRLVVSASELAQMGVCERLVVLEHRSGRRRTFAQRQAIRRGVSAHRRFYRDGPLGSARRGCCFIASLVYGPNAPQTIVLRRFRGQVLRRWWIGRWLILRFCSVAPALCVRLRDSPIAVGLKLGPTEQDKRSVVPIEFEDVDQWLFGTVEQAAGLVRVPGVEVFDARPI